MAAKDPEPNSPKIPGMNHQDRRLGGTLRCDFAGIGDGGEFGRAAPMRPFTPRADHIPHSLLGLGERG